MAVYAFLYLADNDFVPLIETLVFHDSGELCANVTLVMGDSAEDIEKFSVALTSQDERLEVKEYYVPVYIIDSDGECFAVHTCTYCKGAIFK